MKQRWSNFETSVYYLDTHDISYVRVPTQIVASISLLSVLDQNLGITRLLTVSIRTRAVCSHNLTLTKRILVSRRAKNMPI